MIQLHSTTPSENDGPANLQVHQSLNHPGYAQQNPQQNYDFFGVKNEVYSQQRNQLLGNLSLLSSSDRASTLSTVSSNSSSGSSSVENSVNLGDSEGVKKKTNLTESWFNENYPLKRPAENIYNEILNQSNDHSSYPSPYEAPRNNNDPSTGYSNYSTHQTSGPSHESSLNPLETLVNLSNSHVGINPCLNLANSLYSKVSTGSTSDFSRTGHNVTPEFPPNLDNNSQMNGLFNLNNFISENNYGDSQQNQNVVDDSSQVRECVACGVVSASVWRYDTTGHFLCNSCTYLSKNQISSGHSSAQMANNTSANSISSQHSSLNQAKGQMIGKSSKLMKKYQADTFNQQSIANKRPPFKRTGLICSNCETNQTTLWRRNLDAQPVCNACGLYQKLHGRSRPVTMRKDAIQTRKRKSKKRRDSSAIQILSETARNSDPFSAQNNTSKTSQNSSLDVSRKFQGGQFTADRTAEYNWKASQAFSDENNPSYKSQFENWSSNFYNYYNNSSSASTGPDFDSIVTKNLSSMFTQNSGGICGQPGLSSNLSAFPSTNDLMNNLKTSFSYPNDPR